MPTADEIYGSTVRKLPPEEQLRLASLILNDLAQSSEENMDAEAGWSEEDLQNVPVVSVKGDDPLHTGDTNVGA